MAARGTISQRISLEGDEEIRRQLAELGESLTKAFSNANTKGVDFSGLADGEKIAERFGQALGGKLRTGLSDLANDLQKVIVNVAAFGAAVAAAGAGFLVLIDGASKTVDSLGDLAQEAGTTIQNMSGLKSALSEFGVSQSQLESAFTRLATTTATAWQQIQREVKNAANQVVADQNAIVQSQLRLQAANTALKNSDTDLANTQVSNALSVAGAKLGLLEAENALAKLEGRTPPHSDAIIAKDKARLALAQARLRLEQEQEKAERAAEAAAAQRAQQVLAQQQAELQLSQARAKAAEHAANDINNLAKYIDNLSRGFVDAGLKVNTTTDNLVKGILASVGAGAEGLRDFQGSLAGLAAEGPATFDVLMKLADVFKNMPDGPAKAALGVKLFGRTVARDMVDALSQGSAALKVHIAELEKSGIAFNKADEEGAKAFRRTRIALTDTATAIKDKIALIFAPISQQVLDTFKQALTKNFVSIEEFFKNVEKTVTPVIAALVNAMLGLKAPDMFEGATQEQAAQIAKIQQWQATFEQWRDSIVQFFTATLPAMFARVTGILDSVAAGFNKVFGTKLTGKELGIGLIVGQLIGLNKVALDLITVFGALGLILAAVFIANPAIGAITIALGLLAAAVGYVIFKWDDMASAMQPIADLINKIAGTSVTAKEVMVGAIAAISTALLALAANALLANAAFLTLLRNPAFRTFALVATLLSQLGDSLGLSTEKTKELDAAAKSTAPTLQELIRSVLGVDGAAAGGGVDALGKSLQGLGPSATSAAAALDNLKTKGEEALASIAQQLKNKGQAFAPTIAGANAAADAYEGMGVKIIRGTRAAVTSIDELKAGFARFAQGISPEALAGFAAQLSRVNDLAARSKLAEGVLGPDLGRQMITALTQGSDALQKFIEKLTAPKAASVPEEVKKLAEESKNASPAVEGLTGKIGELKAAGEGALPLADKVKELGTEAPKTATGLQAIDQAAGQLAVQLRGVNDAIDKAAFGGLVSGFESAIASMSALWEAFKAKLVPPVPPPPPMPSLTAPGTPADGGLPTDFSSSGGPGVSDLGEPPDASAWQAAFDAITAAANACAQAVTSAMAAITDSVQQAAAGIQGAFDAGFQSVTVSVQNLQTGIQTAVQAMVQAFESAFQQIEQRAQTAAQAIVSAMQQAAQAAAQAAAAAANAGGSGGGNAGYARGGYLKGPGTGTSDSMIVRVSSGEYVLRAAAVRWFGLGNVERINRRQWPRLPKFSMGGLVDTLGASFASLLASGLPAFAEGGLALSSGGSSLPRNVINLTMPDGTRFGGLLARDQVAREVINYAVREGAISAGRKPSFVG